MICVHLPLSPDRSMSFRTVTARLHLKRGKCYGLCGLPLKCQPHPITASSLPGSWLELAASRSERLWQEHSPASHQQRAGWSHVLLRSLMVLRNYIISPACPKNHLRRWWQPWCLGLLGGSGGYIGFRVYTPIMENQMENKMEHEMDTGIIWGVIGIIV